MKYSALGLVAWAALVCWWLSPATAQLADGTGTLENNIATAGPDSEVANVIVWSEGADDTCAWLTIEPSIDAIETVVLDLRCLRQHHPGARFELVE